MDSEPFRYDEATSTFSLYTEDFYYLGEWEVVLKAWFVEYPESEDINAGISVEYI